MSIDFPPKDKPTTPTGMELAFKKAEKDEAQRLGAIVNSATKKQKRRVTVNSDTFKSGKDSSVTVVDAHSEPIRALDQTESAELKTMQDDINRYKAEEMLISPDVGHIDLFEGEMSPNAESVNVLGEELAPDATPLETKSRADKAREQLRGLIAEREKGEHADNGIFERIRRSREYLNNRAKDIDAKAHTSGAEQVVQWMGGLYNKLNTREKIGIGIVFGAGAVVSGGASIYLPYAFAGLLGVQRAFGMASLYMSQQEELFNAKITESGQIISAKERAAITAVTSGALMGAAIGKTVEWASESGVAERTREWIAHMLGHDLPTSTGPVIAKVEATQDVSQKLTSSALAEVATATSVMPEMPTVGASVRGYEGMLKDLIQKLPDTPPSNIDTDSDLARLYEAKANPESVNTAIHKLAMEHKFYTSEGSVLIDVGDQMTVDSQGNILFNGEIQAPENPSFTLAPQEVVQNPEPPFESTVESGVVPESPSETVALEEVDLSENGPIPERIPAPIEDRSYVLNKFDLPITVAEPHIYADAGAKHLLVYGGTPIQRVGMIEQFLKENPDKVVFSGDDNDRLRLMWRLENGRAIPATSPMRTRGFFGLFSSLMKPPGPDELRKLIK